MQIRRDSSAGVVKAGPTAELQHEVRSQLDGDEGNAVEVPGGPVRGARSSERQARDAHAKEEDDAADEPRGEARCDLHDALGGETRAEEVEEPEFNPVAAERRPEREKSGGCEAGEPAAAISSKRRSEE